jgi:hypothetical protein
MAELIVDDHLVDKPDHSAGLQVLPATQKREVTAFDDLLLIVRTLPAQEPSDFSDDYAGQCFHMELYDASLNKG